MIGAGKLGLPVALAIESKGHDVTIYDVNPAVEGYVHDHQIPYVEEGLQPLLDTNKLHVAKSIGEVVARSDIIFLAIQTPHDKAYEGTTRLPDDRKDFDYTYLEDAIRDVSRECGRLATDKIVAVISTCLPGTYNRQLKHLTNEHVKYVYTPQFIAMGTVLEDYLNPEFNLIGVEDEEAADTLEKFYKTINDAPPMRTDITTAEAIKVSYNTFITMKTVLANTWGEIAQKVEANADDIYKAWSMSGKRLLSPRYLKAGVGDGGGCHPRDNIALSHLAQELNLSHNLFEDLMTAREDHMDWLGRCGMTMALEYELPLVILGKSFKPETNIDTGSPAILMNNLIQEYGFPVEQHEDVEELGQAVYLIGTAHERYIEYNYPPGSIVIDPFGIIPDKEGITVTRIGRL